MEPETTSSHHPRTSSTRYMSREQALPNSSRRIARASQRNSSSKGDGEHRSSHKRDDDRDKCDKYRDRTEDLIDHLKQSHRASSSRSRRNREDASHRDRDRDASSKDADNNRNADRERVANQDVVPKDAQDGSNRRQHDRSKRREKEQRIKEIHDLINNVKNTSIKEKDRDGSKRREERRQQRLQQQQKHEFVDQKVAKHQHQRYAVELQQQQQPEEETEFPLPPKEEEIDGADELSDVDFVEEEFVQSSSSEGEEEEEYAQETIDEVNYNHTTYYDEEGNVMKDRFGLSDSDLGHLACGDADSDDNEEDEDDYCRNSAMDSVSEYYGQADSVSEYYGPGGVSGKISVDPRSNSPELNPNFVSCGEESQEERIVTRKISSDPPTASSLGGAQMNDLHTSMEPNEEIGSVYQRELELDAPPSPKGPELRRREPDSVDEPLLTNVYRVGSRPAANYTNYALDDVGRDQYNKMIVPFQHQQEEEGVRKRPVQQDPPESNRGLDVPAPRGPRVSSSKSKREEKKRQEKKKQPELKSILRRKGSPPVVSYFGKPVNDEVSSGSEPEVTETKQGRVRIAAEHDGGDKCVVSSKISSGLRSGKYSNINDAAKKNSSDSDNDSKDDSFSIEENSDDESDDDATMKTITESNDERFDRSKTYYLRTSDLGLTQDTIFAEQFLDNPKSKAEPHYHHPSPHPPPNIQFHVDENYLAINDGKGGYSPVAPQAVDALVAIGYRTAVDPVMWTPSSKTRKYMTERGLRFGDVPLPGPLDEGEGGPNDSTCMVWSGKFSHKYYGHDLLAIRSQGVINMSAEELVDLLMDSDRIKEYNKSSNGRTDEIILSDGTNLDSCPFSGRRKKKLTGVVMENARIVDGVAILDSQSEDERSDYSEVNDDDGNRSYTSAQSRKKESTFVGVTKVVRSVNIIPLVKKKVDFVTLVHCRALTDDQGGNGYIIVGRNVYPADDAEKCGKGVIRSEVLLNVHIIRKFKPQKKGASGKKGKGDSRSVVSSASGQAASARELANRCLMTNVSHLKSPMIPSLMAKKMGCAAAASFINDIRALTDYH